MHMSLSDVPVSHEGLCPASVTGQAGVVQVRRALHTGNLALRMTEARGNVF